MSGLLPNDQVNNLSVSERAVGTFVSASLVMGAIVVAGIVLVVSPIVGVIGLLCTAIRSIHDVAQRALAMNTPRSDDPKMEELRQRKIKYYDDRLNENTTYAKAFGMMLAPVASVPLLILKRDLLIASMITTIADVSGVFPCASKLLLKGVFPLSGTSLENYAVSFYDSLPPFLQSSELLDSLDGDHLKWFKEYRKNWVKSHRGENFKLKTGDNRQIDVVRIPGVKANQNGPTVVLFHGNGCILDQMQDLMRFYKVKGVNVVMVTMGGYPGSAENVPTSELTTYEDVEAISQYLKGLGVANKDMIAHGQSMGGSLAIKFGLDNPGAKVIADQTFTTLKQVFKNIVSSNEAISPLNRLFSNSSFLPKDRIQGAHVTDGLNNLKKIKQLQGPFLAIKSSNDNLMNISEVENCADRLAKAYTKAKGKLEADVKLDDRAPKARHVISIHGEHCMPFTHDSEACLVLEKFLAAAV